MTPEMILLIVSLVGNVMILFKRIQIIWTPCLILDCRSTKNDSVDDDIQPSSEPTIFKRAIEKLTPRKKTPIIITQ